MNRALWQFISILIICFIVLAAYSFTSFNIKFGDIEIKKSKIKEFFLETDSVESYSIINLKHLTDTIDSDDIVIDTTSQKILLIGDSMLEGLMLRLRDYTAFNGHEMKSVIWYSSSSLWYGTCDTLKHFINEYDPTYVMLVLGANELFIRDIKNKRLKYVKKIINQIGDLPYVWVGPPNWKDDTGINDLILQNAGKYNYFASKYLTYNRTKDGAHPTKSSSVMWMDSIVSWINNESLHRLKLNTPDKRYKISPNATLLQPKK